MDQRSMVGAAERAGWRARLGAELKKASLATAYFLVGFNLPVVMIALLVPGAGSIRRALATATLLALVVGKVVVVSEGWVERLVRRGSSFTSAVVQRAAWFTVVVLFALALEAVLHGVLGEDMSWSAAVEHAVAEGSWTRLAARALYLMVLFAFYGFLFELNGYFAPRSLTEVVFARYRRPCPRPIGWARNWSGTTDFGHWSFGRTRTAFVASRQS